MMNKETEKYATEYYECNTLIIGSGCAAYNAADSLYDLGQRDLLIATEGRKMGTSRNTGSDKQTYYKLSLADDKPDSIYEMAKTLYGGGAVDGDTALVEAANSVRSFFKLVNLGVPFPHDEYGQYVGYQTDHDATQRATSCGPLTSKYMTEKLEASIKKKEIKLLDGVRIVKILKENESQKVYGAIGIRTEGEGSLTWIKLNCTNIIYATGGPSGIYHRSVYPVSQTGSHGPAFAAGAKGKNLTEFQYGIASVLFRWNLSGSYQQVIPRYYSVDENGEDEREFLLDYFETPAEMLTAVFLKGYQWPFDPRKVGKSGSSLVDIAVYQEEIIKHRKVYLDFRRNPKSAERDGVFDFRLLKKEAYDYLENSEILFGTPIERLLKMNQPAYQLYLDHGIDLSRDPLEISVSAQHNNGGLAANQWWESNVKHLFPVGEVCGNFGVYRPGGSALNATQVGSLRAAQFISSQYRDMPLPKEIFEENSAKEFEKTVSFSEALRQNDHGQDPLIYRRQFQKEFDQSAAFLRNPEKMETQRRVIDERLQTFEKTVRVKDAAEVRTAFVTYDLLLTQKVYLSAMLSYIKSGGESRGSYLIEKAAIDLSKIKTNGIPLELDGGARDEIVQLTTLIGEETKNTYRDRHPLPKTKSWFEQIYKQYIEGKII